MPQRPQVTATDDPVLAQQLGFTAYDEIRGQWVPQPLVASEEPLGEVEQPPKRAAKRRGAAGATVTANDATVRTEPSGG